MKDTQAFRQFWDDNFPCFLPGTNPKQAMKKAFQAGWLAGQKQMVEEIEDNGDQVTFDSDCGWFVV